MVLYRGPIQHESCILVCEAPMLFRALLCHN